jgi:prevent-host-death family protein
MENPLDFSTNPSIIASINPLIDQLRSNPMESRVSATEARIRFGELMQQAVESRRPIVVERGGKPYVVVLSIAEYERLQATQQRESWRESLERAIQVGARIKNRQGDKPLTPPEKIIRQVREDRSEGLADLR